VRGSPPNARLIRLATYNIHRAIGRDRRFDPERIARVVKEFDADVIALQEVESQHGDLGLLQYLARETGLSAVAGPTMLRTDAEYGNALLARGRFAEVERIDLSVPDREPRGALDVRLECRGALLRVLATHLGLRPAERRRQIRHLLARLDPTDSVPTVLMGDLNEWFLWGRPLRWLHAFFGETPAPATFPSHFPVFALDRLWVKPRDRLRTMRVHASPLARLASDHLPLVTELEI
jgi:endonuclease/exonuclease/phosphatase family metal-dependent hydrolase